MMILAHVVLFIVTLMAAPAEAPIADTLGAHETFASGTREPSGVAWDAARRRVWIVGDEGTLAALDAQGGRLYVRAFGRNLEDVAVHAPSGRLVLLAEDTRELIVWDPDTDRVTGRFALERAALLGGPPHRDGGAGFEGIAFRPEKAYAGGGVFYLVHQRDPVMMVALAFDPTQPGGPLGADAVVTRWPLGLPDATAVSYVPGLDRLFVLSNRADTIEIVGLDARVVGRMHVPGQQQEGLAMDGSGQLWVADDRAGTVLRFEQAMPVVRAALAHPPALEKQRATKPVDDDE